MQRSNSLFYFQYRYVVIPLNTEQVKSTTNVLQFFIGYVMGGLNEGGLLLVLIKIISN